MYYNSRLEMHWNHCGACTLNLINEDSFFSRMMYQECWLIALLFACHYYRVDSSEIRWVHATVFGTFSLFIDSFFFRAGIHVLCVVFRGLNVSYQNGSINRLFAQCPGDYLNIWNIISLSYAKIIQNPPFIGDLFYTCDRLWHFLLLMQWVCHLLNLSCW